MNNRTIRGAMSSAALACGALALTGTPAAATNGYFSNGVGVESKAMAGAAVAVDTGVLGLAQNPALGFNVGNQAEACLSIFSPHDRGFSVGAGGPLTPGTYVSTNDIFYIPCIGANFLINDQVTLGFQMFGNGGMNTEYAQNPFAGLGAGSSPLGVNLEQLFVTANISVKANDDLTFGFAPVFALQRFSATGLEAFQGLSVDPTAVTNNGDDWSNGFGANVGVLWEPAAGLAFGAAYRSKIDMDPFDKYAGLFAGGGDFDIPATATLGAAYTLPSNPQLTLTTEYQRIFYSDVPAIANSGAVLATPLGAANGPGFGWDDMDVFRVGAVYEVDKQLTVRGGVSYATAFTTPEEVLLNVLAPATPQWHASIGATYRLNDKWSVSGSYTHVFDNELSGANQTPGFGQPITLTMVQDEVAIGMNYSW